MCQKALQFGNRGVGGEMEGNSYKGTQGNFGGQ